MNRQPSAERFPSLRRIASGVVGTGLTLLLLVVAVAAFLRTSVTGADLSRHPTLALAGVLLVPATCGLLVFGTLRHLSRHGWLGWKFLSAAGALTTAAFLHLLDDEPELRHPQSAEEFSPVLAGDRESFQLTLRFSRQVPGSQPYQAPRFQVGPGTVRIRPDPAGWASFLRENRTAIEAGWQELQPVRSWWAEMAALPRLGDLTPAAIDAPILPFPPVRAYAQYACAIGSLQALDGKGDEAVATLVGTYSVARKLEANSRTLVRSMTARVIEGLVLETLGFVLDSTSVSPAAQAVLRRELNATAGGPAGARRLAWIEYQRARPEYFLSLFSGEPAGDHTAVQLLFAGLSSLVINRHRTLNLIGDRTVAIAELAADGRIEELKALEAHPPGHEGGWFPIRNCGGYFLAASVFPAHGRMAEHYWKQENRRGEVLRRLSSALTS